jgi:hypothetical protein
MKHVTSRILMTVQLWSHANMIFKHQTKRAQTRKSTFKSDVGNGFLGQFEFLFCLAQLDHDSVTVGRQSKDGCEQANKVVLRHAQLIRQGLDGNFLIGMFFQHVSSVAEFGKHFVMEHGTAILAQFCFEVRRKPRLKTAPERVRTATKLVMSKIFAWEYGASTHQFGISPNRLA